MIRPSAAVVLHLALAVAMCAGTTSAASRSLLDARPGNATAGRDGPGESRFVAATNKEYNKLAKEIQRHPTAKAVFETFRSAPQILALLPKLPAMQAANLRLMTVAYAMGIAIRTSTDPAEVAAASAIYQRGFHFHLAHGQALALEALGYSPRDVSEAALKYLDIYRITWDVQKTAIYSAWTWGDYAANADRDWDQLVAWAAAADPAVNASPVVAVPNPFQVSLTSPLNTWFKANYVLDFEKHFWEVKAGLLRGVGSDVQKRLVLYNFWHWESLFQLTLLQNPTATFASLIKSFLPFVEA